MDRQAFKQRMQNLKSYRENNPGKGYWDWKVEAFQGGGEIGNEERQYLHSWYTNRREYAKRHMPAMLKQLDDADIYIDPNSGIRNIYSTPITISNDKIKQASKDSGIGEYGGYYHPNEGVVLPSDYKQWKDREPLLHELNHVVNTFNSSIFDQVNKVLEGKQIIDRGQEVNNYLTTPSEVQSRLIEFRKLNNLDPTKVYGIPDVREWRRTGKDADLLNTFDDDTVLELINTVAHTPNKKVQRAAEGGQTGDPEKERFYQATGRSSSGRPLEEGLKPVFSLEDAANMTPIGDAISAKDAYDAVKNRDWLGAGLAASAMIPFIPNVYRSLKSKISREVPTVTRSFQRQVDANDLRRDLENNNRRRVLEEYSDQRNRTYELLNTPEARRRAQIIDRKYSTEYNKVYDDLTKEYEDINSYVNLPEPNFVSNKKDYANIDPSKSKIINLSTDNIRTAEDYPKGLIRHEIGHYVDEKAYPGGVPNNAYLRQLGKPSKYRSFSEVEHMFPDKDRAKSIYEYLRRPTEKKSIMNQFDEYLMNTLTPSTYPTNTKQFRQVIESAPDLYNNMKMLLKIHTKPSVLYKDFLARPLVNKINKNKNQEIV